MEKVVERLKAKRDSILEDIYAAHSEAAIKRREAAALEEKINTLREDLNANDQAIGILERALNESRLGQSEG
jgi:predicted RNase H-like nuclease (RuvC/YqgF family)